MVFAVAKSHIIMLRMLTWLKCRDIIMARDLMVGHSLTMQYHGMSCAIILDGVRTKSSMMGITRREHIKTKHLKIGSLSITDSERD